MRLKDLVVTAAVALLATATPPAAAETLDGADMRRIFDEDSILTDSSLSELVRALDNAGARAGRTQNVGGEVVVEVHYNPGASNAAHAAILSAGGRATIEVAGWLWEAAVPIVALPALEADPAVRLIRRLGQSAPTAPTFAAGFGTQAVTGSHVREANASQWHTAGFDGSGVKVGIVDFFNGSDWSAGEASGDLPPVSDSFCKFGTATCNVFGIGTPQPSHGVAVAEIVHDMAPGAELYLASVGSASDLQAAVEFFDAAGVQVITRSLASTLDGPGDGTGPFDAVADDAVARGIVFINSAGNHAGNSTRSGTYWRGTWADDDDDGWLDFSPGVEDLAFACRLNQGIRWSDWDDPAPTDYDVYWASAAGDDGVLLGGSENPQSEGADPLEAFDCPVDSGGNALTGYFRVRLFDPGSGTDGDVIEFMFNGGSIEDSSNAYSAGQPISDSVSPGVLSVGAIDPATGNLIGVYSSQGPTNDGRTKPDIAAHSCVATRTYGSSCFNGTSAASPVVAGAAALVIGSGLATAPAAVVDYLLDAASVDRGITGPDNIFGNGELLLPDAADPCGSGLARAPFADMAGSFAVAFVDCIYSLGVTTGTSASTYSPRDVVTRDQMAAFIARLYGKLNGSPAPVVATSFTDVGSSFARDDIARIFGLAVTTGTSATTYSPKDPVTREQMAAFLARLYRSIHGSDAPTVATPFTDTGSSFAKNDIARIYGLGLTTGTSPTRYSPQDPVTREQMAAFLARLFDALRLP